MSKRTETTIEIHQVQIIRRRQQETDAWCAVCAATVRMVTPEAAAVLAGVTTRTIYRWIEVALVHFTESPEGALLICANSLTSTPPTETEREI